MAGTAIPLRACVAAITLASFAIALAAAPSTAHAANECYDARRSNALGVSRVIEIDTSNGPLFGHATRYAREPDFLAPKEVVLTFDDGPMPWITRAILAELERHCTRATFFAVGRMAVAYPEMVRAVLAAGHTLGAHTWSHPQRLPSLDTAVAIDEIDKGFAAIARAAGKPIAPFFRFPGLSDSPALMEHLRAKGVGIFTVDVISDDSFIGDTARLVATTLQRIEHRGGGIVLFHDIKPQTARALPAILDGLKARGYRVVHLVSKHAHVASHAYDDEVDARLARGGHITTGSVNRPGTSTATEPTATPSTAARRPVPFFGAIPPAALVQRGATVTNLAPAARAYEIAKPHETAPTKLMPAPPALRDNDPPEEDEADETTAAKPQPVAEARTASRPTAKAAPKTGASKRARAKNRPQRRRAAGQEPSYNPFRSNR